MIKYVYCAVNQNNEIQVIQSSSRQNIFYLTDKYLPKKIQYHNHYHPNDQWTMKKYKLTEVPFDEVDI